MNLYKNCTSKPYLFLVIHTTLISDNSSCFSKNLLERIEKLILTIDDKIRCEKLLYDINTEVAKISALSSDKIDKYAHFSGKEILFSNQRQIIKQAKIAYSILGKAFKKQIKQLKIKE